MQLGIPGIGFRTEKRRFYPGGATASHIVGLTNIDNQGIAGIEKYIDDQGLADLQASGLAVANGPAAGQAVGRPPRPAHRARRDSASAMERYQAIAAGAVVLNVKTGEVVAMASLPDYDPNNPFNAHDKDRLNRMSAGVYEMGSTFKSFTIAMALDSGKVTLESRSMRRARSTSAASPSSDFHGKRRVLTRAGGVHLLVEHRLGQGGRRGRHRGPPRIPAAAGPARPAEDRTAGGGEADRAEGLEEDQLDHRRLRPRHVDDAAADRGRPPRR